MPLLMRAAAAYAAADYVLRCHCRYDAAALFFFMLRQPVDAAAADDYAR